MGSNLGNLNLYIFVGYTILEHKKETKFLSVQITVEKKLINMNAAVSWRHKTERDFWLPFLNTSEILQKGKYESFGVYCTTFIWGVVLQNRCWSWDTHMYSYEWRRWYETGIELEQSLLGGTSNVWVKGRLQLQNLRGIP